MSRPVESFAPTAVPAAGKVSAKVDDVPPEPAPLTATFLRRLVRVEVEAVPSAAAFSSSELTTRDSYESPDALVQVPRVLAVLVRHDVPVNVLDRRGR
jgi:hypothetical protein